MTTRYKKLSFWAVTLIPIFVTFQTLDRFIFWEATTGRLIKTVSSVAGSNASRYFIVQFLAEGKVYKVRSSTTHAYKSSFSNKSKIGVLYNPMDPNNATIKYRHGQLEKMVYYFIFWAGFWFVIRMVFRARSSAGAKSKRMRDALPLNLIAKNPEFSQMIDAGEKIEAIKYLRRKYLLSLKDAKLEVEKYI